MVLVVVLEVNMVVLIMQVVLEMYKEANKFGNGEIIVVYGKITAAKIVQ